MARHHNEENSSFKKQSLRSLRVQVKNKLKKQNDKIINPEKQGSHNVTVHNTFHRPSQEKPKQEVPEIAFGLSFAFGDVAPICLLQVGVHKKMCKIR